MNEAMTELQPEISTIHRNYLIKTLPMYYVVGTI